MANAYSTLFALIENRCRFDKLQAQILAFETACDGLDLEFDHLAARVSEAMEGKVVIITHFGERYIVEGDTLKIRKAVDPFQIEIPDEDMPETIALQDSVVS